MTAWIGIEAFDALEPADEPDRIYAPRMMLEPRWIMERRLHGTRGSYVEGCRCVACTRAERLYQRVYQRARRARLRQS